MNKEEANIKAKKVYDEWLKQRALIEEKAKKDGTWQENGFDSNNVLFKELDEETKKQLELIKANID